MTDTTKYLNNKANYIRLRNQVAGNGTGDDNDTSGDANDPTPPQVQATNRIFGVVELKPGDEIVVKATNRRGIVTRVSVDVLLNGEHGLYQPSQLILRDPTRIPRKLIDYNDSEAIYSNIRLGDHVEIRTEGEPQIGDVSRVIVDVEYRTETTIARHNRDPNLPPHDGTDRFDLNELRRPTIAETVRRAELRSIPPGTLREELPGFGNLHDQSFYTANRPMW